MSKRILILGASYGILPGIRLALAGHQVTLVGKAQEVAEMRHEPLRLEIAPQRGYSHIVLEVPSNRGVELTTAADACLNATDLVMLAMQEPQYADPAVAALMTQIADANLPCLSIMNMPAPPYLYRLGGIDPAVLEGVYASAAVWKNFEPAQITIASPDPQALRLDPARPGSLTVTFASNFKAAPFSRLEDQRLLEELARDWAGYKQAGKRPPVQLLARHSLYAPLAKWPMLIAGNCRSLTANGLRSVGNAVHDDLAVSEQLYQSVQSLARALGARERDLVPFAVYARAATGLTRPSSLARALAGGAQQVERIDLLILRLMQANGLDTSAIIPVVELVEHKLASNAVCFA